MLNHRGPSGEAGGELEPVFLSIASSVSRGEFGLLNADRILNAVGGQGMPLDRNESLALESTDADDAAFRIALSVVKILDDRRFADS